MFKNYLKIALRNLLKFKLFSFINLAGLSVGIAGCFLILLYVQDDLSYDRYHARAENIYRVTSEEYQEGNLLRLANSYAPLAPALLSDFPDVQQATRLFPYSVVAESGPEKRFQEERFFFCDSTIFEIFSCQFLQGDPQTALSAPNSVAIIASAAKKYFGAQNPLGKILTIENQLDLEITAVLADASGNSHFHFDFLAPVDNLKTLIGEWVLDSHKSWYWPPVYTYVLLPENYPVGSLEERFPQLVEKHIGEWAVSKRTFRFQPLTGIYLHSDLENEIAPTGSIARVYVLLLIAFLILLMACINFMNLATARSSRRAREIGLRKTLGAGRRQLVRQFLGESLVYAFLALGIAIMLVELFLPAFNNLAGKRLTLNYLQNPLIFPGLPALVFLTGIVAGSYPAFFLANLSAIRVLQGKLLSPGKGKPFRLRPALVVFQFVISVALIVMTFGVNRQLDFLRSERLGFDKERVMIIPIREEEMQDNFQTFKNQFLNLPGVAQAAAISNLPWQQGFYDFPVRAEGYGDDTSWNLPTLIVDEDFIRTFGMEIVQGRDFSKERPSDAAEAFILNETAAKKLGWEPAIGKTIEMEGVASGEPRKGEVIGVVKDFHLRSLHYVVDPLVLIVSPESYYLDYLALRLKPGNVSNTIAALRERWSEVAPQRPFEFRFLDEEFERLYRKEHKLAQVFRYFSLLAIFVACLGLFGLASFTASARTKEIGVRKVLGASVQNIVALLSGEFAKWVLIANLIAWPIAWFAMRKWLENFAYRVEIGWGIFLLSGALVLLIALLTVSYQAIRAALSNPVEALRYE